MTRHPLLDLIAQKEDELRALKLTANMLALPLAEGPLTGPRHSSQGHPFGNGEPDAELAEAAGMALTPVARTDKWRKYLALRRAGKTFWQAAGKAKIHRDTAQRLDALV